VIVIVIVNGPQLTRLIKAGAVGNSVWGHRQMTIQKDVENVGFNKQTAI